MATIRFEIEQGVLAFAPVDDAAVGYTPDWLAPAGQGRSTPSYWPTMTQILRRGPARRPPER